MDYEALAKKYGGSPAEVKGRPDDIDALAKQFGGKLTSSAEPESRNLFYVANDTVIAIANAAASGVKAAADFVSPGNSFSKAIDEFVKKGEESQSDIVKAAREKYAQDMEEAKGFMEEVSATGKYLAGSPLQAAGMALGSFAGPGLAIKGATKGAQLLNASEKVASRLGLGTGVVTGAAMSGGDAAGSAYEMVMQTPDDILMQNDLIKSQVEAGRSLEEIKQEAATTAARRASIVPALIGGVSGAFGVERILAGLGGKEAAKSLSAAAIKSGLTEAIQEGIEEGATEYSARAAAQTYDPRIDPMKGVAGAATMGAVLGAIPGAAIGALDASRRIQADELQKSIEAARAAYEQETAAAETAAQEQAAKITQTAVPDETGKVTPSSFDISALDLAGVSVPETTTTEQKPDVVPAKKKDETAEQKITRYKAELAVGEDASGKKITPSHRKSIEASLAKLEEEIRAKQLTTTVAGAGEPSAEGIARELGTAAGEPVTSVSAGVEPTGGAPKLSVSGEGAQRPSLEEQYRSLPTEELITIYDDFLGDPSESQAAKAELIRRGEYAPIRIAELEEVLKNPNIESERRVRLETELNELKGEQGAEPTPIEPTVTEPATDLGQPVVEAKEEPTEEPAAEAVSAAPTEVTEEQAPVEITPDIEQTAQQLYNDYVTQQLEAGVPSMLPWEQISQTTKQPFYDAALAATKPSAGEQVFARMAEDISKTTEKTAKEEKVTEEKKAEPVKKAAPAKKETKAQREVREAEEEIKKLETTEKKKPAVKMREEKVKVALKSGSGFQVASAIAAGYDPKKSLTVDNITQVFAQRLAKLMSAFDHEPEIVVGKVEGNRPGKYDPETETITIDPSAPRNVPLESVILHELTHYAADRMIDNYDKLTPEQKQNIKELDKLHKYVQSFLGEKYEIPTLKEFVAEAFSNTKFQQDMAALPPMKTKNLLTAFAERILMMLGFRDRAYNTLGDVVSNVDQLIFGPRRGESKEISYAPKAVGPVTDRSFDEMVDEMKSDKPIAFSTKAKEIAMTGKGREAGIRVVQNDRIANERWQDRLMAQGRIIAYGLGFNNIYDQITLASGNADYIYKQYVQNIAQDIYDNVTDYANEYGVSTDRALKELGQFAIAKHYDERRKILYLKTVPLSDAKIIPYKGQVNLSPAEVRTEIFKKLDEDEKLSEADIKALRSLLDKIVFDPSQKFLDNKNPDLLNITNTKYDVAGAYTDSEIATIMREYEARRPAVDKVLNKIKQLNKVNIDLNRQANYMSKFADNWIDFYGWENYIPLKGKGLSEEAQLLDLDSRKLGGELQEAQHSMEGRITPPDNPILQVMSDGALAALRVGRKNVTQAIYNAVDQELIAGDKKTISFAERNNIKKLEEYRGESTIFHYMPDGNVAVIKLKDKAQREAIRRTYRETSPLIDKANLITGFFGQLHTRYNVSFAPLNFVRDVLTNAFTLGADLGPTKTFEYIGAIAAGVVRQQYKAAKFSWLYSNGKIDEIRALAMKDKSGYFRDMLEYVKTGGKVSYIAGIAPKGQYSEFMKASGGGKILTTKRQIDKFFDMWIDSFELTARVAAYRISKSTEKARLVSEGVSEADAEQGAKVAGAAYAKNLANFEQVGEWGKALGAFYMFFRPSATGAVRAIKAISPAFMDVKDAKTRLPEYAEMLNLRQQLKTEKVEGKKKEKMEARLAELEKAVSKFESTYAEKKKHARVMAASLIGMGYMIYLMSKSMADDDDLGRNKVSTDDMARWTRNARFFIPGSDIIIQIPWGFGLGAFAAFGAQLASLGDANTDFSDTVANMATIALDSFIPVPASRISAIDHPLQFTLDSIMPSVARPLLELGMNMDALGRQIYNNRQSRFGEAYTGGDNIPEIYKNAARYWFDETGMDVGPGVLYFLANNYADGVSRLVQNTYNSALWMQGDKDFNAKTDMLVFDGFIGSKSNFDARQWQKVEDDLKDRQKIVNMLKDNKPDRYAEYLAAHPLDQMLVDMYNQDVNGYLRDLRAEANKFRAMEGLSPKDRKAIVDSIVLQQNLEKFRLVQLYKAMDIEP